MGQDILDVLTKVIKEPAVNAPHIEYNAFKRKDTMAYVTLLNEIVDDLMMEFSILESAKAI